MYVHCSTKLLNRQNHGVKWLAKTSAQRYNWLFMQAWTSNKCVKFRAKLPSGYSRNGKQLYRGYFLSHHVEGCSAEGCARRRRGVTACIAVFVTGMTADVSTGYQTAVSRHSARYDENLPIFLTANSRWHFMALTGWYLWYKPVRRIPSQGSLRDGSSPVGLKGKGPVRDMGDKVPRSRSILLASKQIVNNSGSLNWLYFFFVWKYVDLALTVTSPLFLWRLCWNFINSVHPAAQDLWKGEVSWRARGARAYNGGLRALSTAGSRGRAPGQGLGGEARVRGRSPPEAERFKLLDVPRKRQICLILCIFQTQKIPATAPCIDNKVICVWHEM